MEAFEISNPYLEEDEEDDGEEEGELYEWDWENLKRNQNLADVWNKVKKEEFAERKAYRIVGRTVSFLGLFVLLALLAGCSTANKLAEGVSEKSLSGSGTVAIQRVGIDDETKTPVLKSTVITGDYASARNGDYAFQYRRRKSPSSFNKDAITDLPTEEPME